uniref:Uncharacterized protein n=1 Tax=Tetraselmis sp. GSL018 TaxID=582737 RepID=A0A061RQU6_9CHLO
MARDATRSVPPPGREGAEERAQGEAEAAGAPPPAAGGEGQARCRDRRCAAVSRPGSEPRAARDARSCPSNDQARRREPPAAHRWFRAASAEQRRWQKQQPPGPQHLPGAVPGDVPCPHFLPPNPQPQGWVMVSSPSATLFVSPQLDGAGSRGEGAAVKGNAAHAVCSSWCGGSRQIQILKFNSMTKRLVALHCPLC